MNTKFNEFIKNNKELINSITPKNPSISADDEWREDNEFNRWCDNYIKEGYKTLDIIMCTAIGCDYANKCYRHTKGNDDDINQSYANLEYGCNSNSGFSDYIPLHTEQ